MQDTRSKPNKEMEAIREPSTILQKVLYKTGESTFTTGYRKVDFAKKRLEEAK